jgi:inosine-uridine nucleoside N-ribohydrolase
MTVSTKVKPSLFEFASYKVRVETKGEITAGMTVADRRRWLPESEIQGEKVMICKIVDSRGFKRLLLDRLTGA